ncbi:MAG: hypothetical protein IH994_13130 [Proteobacteria bacterium]|nr:hypothetical protein [Pseudomonadota bacterium]
MTAVRSNKAIALSGCLVNQSLMATGCEAAPAIIRPVIQWALDNDVGLIPWTCPETMFAGLPRKTKGIEGYRKDGFGEAADEWASTFAVYLRRQAKGGIEILAIVGVSFSPACSARRQAYHANERGLYLAALEKHMGDTCPAVIDIDRRKEPEAVKAVLDALLQPALALSASSVHKAKEI